MYTKNKMLATVITSVFQASKRFSSGDPRPYIGTATIEQHLQFTTQRGAVSTLFRPGNRVFASLPSSVHLTHFKTEIILEMEFGPQRKQSASPLHRTAAGC